MLATRKMKNTMTWTFFCRQALALMTGRIMSMAAPVVPTQLARTVPMSRRRALILGVPAKVPLTAMPPATTNRPKRRTIKGT